MSDPNHAERSRTNLSDGFEGFLTPTDDDYRQVLSHGMVVIDANVLLNLYRYASATREDLLAVLDKLGDRLWVPHQVVVEFWRNRESALDDLKKVTNDTLGSLDDLAPQISASLADWAKRISLSAGKLSEVEELVMPGFTAAKEAIQQLVDADGNNGHWDTNRDKILANLKRLLDGKVGLPLEVKEKDEAREEAQKRINEKRPPGYKDAGKADPHGDYLVWLQTLTEARQRQVDVLLVTDDSRSDDWYRRQSGQTRGPRIELIEEMSDRSGVRLFMMRTQSLLYHANRVLQVSVRRSSVEDAARVDERSQILSDESTAARGLTASDIAAEEREMVAAAKDQEESQRKSKLNFQRALEVRDQYRNYLIARGYSVRLTMRSDNEPWDFIAQLETCELGFYYHSAGYAREVELMRRAVGKYLFNESADRIPRSQLGIIVPVQPAVYVVELVSRHELGLIWPEVNGEWSGNMVAVEAGMIS